MSNALTPKKGSNLNISKVRKVYGIGSPVNSVHLRFDILYTDNDVASPKNQETTKNLQKTSEDILNDDDQVISQNTTTTAATRTTNSRSHSNYSNLGHPSTASGRNSRSKSHLFESCELKVHEPEFLKPHITSFDYDPDLDFAGEMLSSDIQSEGTTMSSNELSIRKPPFLDSQKMRANKRMLSQLASAYTVDQDSPEKISEHLESKIQSLLGVEPDEIEEDDLRENQPLTELPTRIPRKIVERDNSILGRTSFSSASESLIVNSEDKENVKIPHFRVGRHFQTPKLKPRKENCMSPINESHLEKINQSLDYTRIKAQDVDELIGNLPGRGTPKNQLIFGMRTSRTGNLSSGNLTKLSNRSGKRLKSFNPLFEETRSLENSIMAEAGGHFSKMSIHKMPNLSLDNTYCDYNQSENHTPAGNRIAPRYGPAVTGISTFGSRKRSISPPEFQDQMSGILSQLRRTAGGAYSSRSGPIDDESGYYLTTDSYNGALTPTYAKAGQGHSRQRKISRQFEQSTLVYQPIPELVSNSSSYVKTDSCFNTSSTPLFKRLEKPRYRRKKSLVPQTSRIPSAANNGSNRNQGQLLHQGSLSMQKFTFETATLASSTQKMSSRDQHSGTSVGLLKHKINERLLENLYLVYSRYGQVLDVDPNDSSVSTHAELQRKYGKYSQVLQQAKSRSILTHIVTSHKRAYTIRYIGIALCMMSVLSSREFFPDRAGEHRSELLKLCNSDSPEMTNDLKSLLDEQDIVNYRLFLIRYHNLNEYSVEISRKVEHLFLSIFRPSMA